MTLQSGQHDRAVRLLIKAASLWPEKYSEISEAAINARIEEVKKTNERTYAPQWGEGRPAGVGSEPSSSPKKASQNGIPSKPAEGTSAKGPRQGSGGVKAEGVKPQSGAPQGSGGAKVPAEGTKPQPGAGSKQQPGGRQAPPPQPPPRPAPPTGGGTSPPPPSGTSNKGGASGVQEDDETGASTNHLHFIDRWFAGMRRVATGMS